MKSKVVLCKLVEDNKRFSIEQPLASIALAVEEYVLHQGEQRSKATAEASTWCANNHSGQLNAILPLSIQLSSSTNKAPLIAHVVGIRSAHVAFPQ